MPQQSGDNGELGERDKKTGEGREKHGLDTSDTALQKVKEGTVNCAFLVGHQDNGNLKLKQSDKIVGSLNRVHPAWFLAWSCVAAHARYAVQRTGMN